MFVEYLDKRPVTVDTPTHRYERFRFVFRDGHGHLVAKTGLTIRSEPGTLAMVGQNVWEMTTDAGVWTIDRAKGCNCRGQPIIEK